MVYCSICYRDDRDVIEGTLRDNISSLRAVARMFNLSKTAVHRHKARHMSATNGSNGATSNGGDHPGKTDASAERDYRALVACFPVGVPQRVGQWPISETVKSWPHDKRVRVLTEAIQRGDLVLDRRGSENATDWHVERPQAGQNTSGTMRK